MCTIAILFDVAAAPLVVAANRDEHYARPTRPPERLGPGIAGGVDVLANGTWLAVHARGFFAAVTNHSSLQPRAPSLRSRGLVVRELASAADPLAYVEALDPRQYAGMNLAWGDANGVRVGYSRPDASAVDIAPLGKGVHVLCNDRLGAPELGRAERVELALRPHVAAPWPALRDHLQHVLGDNTRHDPPSTSPAHLPPDIARALTANCIHSPSYGTRSSTILAIDRDDVRAYLHADGAPCTNPFVDRTELLK
jgi:uncharacterized protein with NRDE domain